MTTWISVEEKQPENRQRVLTYCHVRNEIDVHAHRPDYHDGWWIGRTNYPINKGYITHWAELPESPETKSSQT